MAVLGIWLLELGYAVLYRGLCSWSGGQVSSIMGACSKQGQPVAPSTSPSSAVPSSPNVQAPTPTPAPSVNPMPPRSWVY